MPLSRAIVDREVPTPDNSRVGITMKVKGCEQLFGSAVFVLCACGGGWCLRGGVARRHGCRRSGAWMQGRTGRSGVTSWGWARLCCGRGLMTCRSAGVWGSRACRATLPFEGLSMRAPVSRSRPRLLFVGRRGRPVGDRAFVGGLGLRGELLLGLAHPLAGGPHACGFALQRRRAGFDLEPPELWAVSEGCWWA